MVALEALTRKMAEALMVASFRLTFYEIWRRGHCFSRGRSPVLTWAGVAVLAMTSLENLAKFNVFVPGNSCTSHNSRARELLERRLDLCSTTFASCTLSHLQKCLQPYILGLSARLLTAVLP